MKKLILTTLVLLTSISNAMWIDTVVGESKVNEFSPTCMNESYMLDIQKIDLIDRRAGNMSYTTEDHYLEVYVNICNELLADKNGDFRIELVNAFNGQTFSKFQYLGADDLLGVYKTKIENNIMDTEELKFYVKLTFLETGKSYYSNSLNTNDFFIVK